MNFQNIIWTDIWRFYTCMTQAVETSIEITEPRNVICQLNTYCSQICFIYFVLICWVLCLMQYTQQILWSLLHPNYLPCQLSLWKETCGKLGKTSQILADSWRFIPTHHQIFDNRIQTLHFTVPRLGSSHLDTWSLYMHRSSFACGRKINFTEFVILSTLKYRFITFLYKIII